MAVRGLPEARTGREASDGFQGDNLTSVGGWIGRLVIGALPFFIGESSKYDTHVTAVRNLLRTHLFFLSEHGAL